MLPLVGRALDVHGEDPKVTVTFHGGGQKEFVTPDPTAMTQQTAGRS